MPNGLINEGFNTNISSNELGTQFWAFNPTTSKLEYVVPVIEGATIGGSTESIELPQADKLTIGKLGGRTTLDDITYNSYYTPEKYIRVQKYVGQSIQGLYLEYIGDDHSGFFFSGNGNADGKTSGNPPNIPITIFPTDRFWVEDCLRVTAAEATKFIDMVKAMFGVTITLTAGQSLPFDSNTLPSSHMNNITIV